MNIEWTGERHFSLEPKSPAFYNDPYVFYRELHSRGGPVFWQQYDMWCLAGFDEVDRCLRDKRFARLPPAGHKRKSYPPHLNDFALAEKYSLLALEPPDHTRLRKLVNRAFVSRNVESMAAGINELTNKCIDRFEAHGSAELLSQFATPIPVTVIARLLGIPESDTDQLLAWSHAMVVVYTMTQSYEEELAANQASAEFLDYLRGQIARRRAKPGADLLSQLVLQQQQRDGPTDEEILSVVILLLNAGHEATVHQLGNGIVNLLRNPPANPLWYRDKALAENVVAECLRHDAPLHLFTRFAQEDVALASDVSIASGTEIALLLGAANRCPVKFDDADRFDITRPGNQNLSLGAGIHFCVGAPLARMELRIALCALFERLPGLRLAATPEYRDSFHFHGLQALEVCWDVN